jgi:hypothetical protein
MNIPIVNVTSLAAATSANGTARNGAALVTGWFDPGACHFLCTSAITTSGVIATFKLQGTFDGSTYFDINGATWSSEAGTGGAVTTRKSLTVPTSAQAFKYVRCVATLAGAATAPADTTAVVACYNPFGRLYGAATI